jgi:EAL domain-containing protein (putative c-di-GMP-specific phosphodiesterase class I)
MNNRVLLVGGDAAYRIALAQIENVDLVAIAAPRNGIPAADAAPVRLVVFVDDCDEFDGSCSICSLRTDAALCDVMTLRVTPRTRPAELCRAVQRVLRTSAARPPRIRRERVDVGRRAVEHLVHARRLHDELSSAVAAEQLTLHFQPEVHLPTGLIVGAEALVRWNRDGVVIPAAEFVPYAEEAGLLPQIDAFVFRRAVAAAATFRTIDPQFRVWFNVSAGELSDMTLWRRVRACGSDLRGLGVEITESAVMKDLSNSLRTLRALREAGLAVALDDFGTGHSSLAQLKHLPLNVVKLDRAFVAELPGNARDRCLVEAVVTIGRRFGFETLAEGIETPQQAGWLRDHGTRFGQGYLFGAAMPAGDLANILRMGGRRDPVVPHGRAVGVAG